MNIRAVAILLAVMFPLAGCETFSTKPHHPDLPPSRIVPLYLGWEQGISSLEGEARIEIDSPKREGSLKATLLIQKPHRFRMAAYPPIGGTVFDIAIVRDTLHFHLPREDKLITQSMIPQKGKEEDGLGDLNEIFARSGLAGLILGRSPHAGVPDIKLLDRDERMIRLGVFDEDGLKREEVILEENTLFKVGHLTMGPRGNIALEVRYSKYEKLDTTGIWWPHTITIRCPEKKFRLVLDFNDVELNGRLDPDLFEIEVPEGTEIIQR